MVEEVKTREFQVIIRGNKINRDPFKEVFTIVAKDKRDARAQVNKILEDRSPKSILYKYGVCEERFVTEINPMN